MPNPENLKPATKGEVRNPNGRPKGALGRATIVKKWLDVVTEEQNPLSGNDERLSQSDLMTLALVQKAKEGDVQAFKELMDSAFGKVETALKIDGNLDTSVEVRRIKKKRAD